MSKRSKRRYTSKKSSYDPKNQRQYNSYDQGHSNSYDQGHSDSYDQDHSDSHDQGQSDLYSQGQSDPDVSLYQDEGDLDSGAPTHYEDHLNPDLSYSSLSLYERSPGQPKKSKKKKVLVVLSILMILGLGGAGFYVWKFVFAGTITPVLTNPTKDVCLITGPEALEDPIYENIWAGMEDAEKKHGLSIGHVAITKDTEKDVDTAIDKACKEYHLVICYGQDMADNLAVKAQVYPHIKFILIEGTLLQEGETTPPPNIFEAGFRSEEASYLAGYLAVKKSPINCLGFMGGKDEATMRTYYGFYVGALSVDLNCEIKWGLPGAAYDSNRIKSLASDMYQDGVQSIFNAVDPQSGQIIADAARKENKKMIAFDVASHSSGTEVLATMVKHYDTIVVMLLGAYKDNTLTFGQKMAYGFREKGIDFLKPPGPTDITDDIWGNVEKMKEKILDGTLLIPGTREEFESKYLV